MEELSAEHGINASVLHRWREEFMQRGSDVATEQQLAELKTKARRLETKAGKLQRQVDFLAGALGDKADPSAK